jgi:hypothetical protein
LARRCHPFSNSSLRFKNRKRLKFNRKYEPGDACEDFAKPSAQNLLCPASRLMKLTYNLKGGEKCRKSKKPLLYCRFLPF